MMRRTITVVVVLLAAAWVTGCAAAGPQGAAGTIRVHTTSTTATDTLTVSVIDGEGRTVRSATGPGVGWTAQFTDVPVGRYRVQLLIAAPATHSSDGTVVTSQSVLVQAPAVVTVQPGSATDLTYDGLDWTGVQ